jgi:hypothetical protein
MMIHPELSNESKINEWSSQNIFNNQLGSKANIGPAAHLYSPLISLDHLSHNGKAFDL